MILIKYYYYLSMTIYSFTNNLVTQLQPDKIYLADINKSFWIYEFYGTIVFVLVPQAETAAQYQLFQRKCHYHSTKCISKCFLRSKSYL